MERSLIYKCEKIIRDIATHSANRVKKDKPFRKAIAERLKFENENGWNILCCLMDVLGDTELAKENFLKFDISGPTKIRDYGEQYLRLYGILNAVYLQKSALLSFVELTKFGDKKQIIAKFNLLKIIKLRHVVGSHSVNFIEDGKLNPHQLQRGSLDYGPITTRDSKGTFVDYDLKQLLIEYNTYATELIIQATEKFIKSTQGGQKLKEYNDRLNLVKTEQEGNIVIYPVEQLEPIVVMVIK